MADLDVNSGIVYRETPQKELKADVYRPAEATTCPAVMLIHGGGWESNHHGMFEGHLSYLAKRGYVGVDITHRLSDEATFPAAIKDIKYGIRWLKSRADKYGLDPDRIAIGGHSSGAHLAALAAVTADVPDLEPAEAPNESSSVAAALPMNGPYNLEKLAQLDPAHLFISGFIRRLFGAEYLERREAYRQASCLTHVDGNEPPFLILTSTDDEEVPFRESVQLRDQLEHVGGTADLHIADGGSHVCFARGGTHYESGKNRIESFLEQHL